MLDIQDYANTYTPRGYDDAMDLVQVYYATQAFKARHEDVGSPRASALFGLRSGTIREWWGDTTPDVVRGIEFTFDNRWDSCRPNVRPGRYLATLTMAALAYGSISHTFQAPCVPDKRVTKISIRTAIRELGFEYQKGHGGDYRPTEISVTKEGAYLGRALNVLSALVGEN